MTDPLNIPEAFDGKRLQLTIGLIALSFPFILCISYYMLRDSGCHSPFLPSVSSYYHTKVGTFFTGILFALAMAMLSYKGKRAIDKWLANVASISAILAAIFPTSVSEGMLSALKNKCVWEQAKSVDPVYSGIHYTAAALFFIILIIFCYLFKSKNPKNKLQRNKNFLYSLCAIGMLLSLVFMTMFSYEILLNEEWFIQKKIPVILVGETICLILFGISWIVEYTNVSDLRTSTEAYIE